MVVADTAEHPSSRDLQVNCFRNQQQWLLHIVCQRPAAFISGVCERRAHPVHVLEGVIDDPHLFVISPCCDVVPALVGRRRCVRPFYDFHSLRLSSVGQHLLVDEVDFQFITTALVDLCIFFSKTHTTHTHTHTHTHTTCSIPLKFYFMRNRAVLRDVWFRQAKDRSQLKASPSPTAFVLVGDVCFETKTDVDPP